MEEAQENAQAGRRGIRMRGGRVGRQTEEEVEEDVGPFLIKSGPPLWTMLSITAFQWLRLVEDPKILTNIIVLPF